MRVSTRFEIAATRVPPRARLTVPARDPRDRDPRPQALVVQQTALGGTSPRGGCASQSRDQRRRASLVAADAAGALFHERDFSRASPCVASVAPPPKSAPPLLRHTRWTETEVFAPTKCGKLRRRRGGGGDGHDEINRWIDGEFVPGGGNLMWAWHAACGVALAGSVQHAVDAALAEHRRGEADPAAAPAVVSAVASAKVLPGASSAALERLAAARAGACLASIASAHALRQQPKLSMSA